jgi:hypothetical protein
MYPVHLHLEVRKNLAIGMNRSRFARDYSNYHSPTAFINAHRRLSVDLRKYDIPIDTFAPYGGELTDAQERMSRSTSPSTYTHKSPSAKASQPDSSGVIRTGRGLRIPVVGGTARPVAPAPAPAPTPAPGGTPGTTPAPEPAPSGSAEKSDFWSRLKGKLKEGQVTPGIEEKKE